MPSSEVLGWPGELTRAHCKTRGRQPSGCMAMNAMDAFDVASRHHGAHILDLVLRFSNFPDFALPAQQNKIINVLY